MKQLDH